MSVECSRDEVVHLLAWQLAVRAVYHQVHMEHTTTSMVFHSMLNTAARSDSGLGSVSQLTSISTGSDSDNSLENGASPSLEVHAGMIDVHSHSSTSRSSREQPALSIKPNSLPDPKFSW
jgi:hypothetical protein